MVNEEIGNASSELTCRIASIDNKIRDTESRLGKLFDALETGKYDNDDFAPRLKELRTRQTELGKARILAEAEIALQGETDLHRAKIKSYVLDMKGKHLGNVNLTDIWPFLDFFPLVHCIGDV